MRQKKKEEERVEEVEEKVGTRSLQALLAFGNLNKLKNFFRRFISLSYWINGFCLGFVIWQTIKCMTKYVEKPKGTEISMKQSANVSFPAITVCGIFGKDEKFGTDVGFNLTYLQNDCGIRY